MKACEASYLNFKLRVSTHLSLNSMRSFATNELRFFLASLGKSKGANEYGDPNNKSCPSGLGLLMAI